MKTMHDVVMPTNPEISLNELRAKNVEDTVGFLQKGTDKYLNIRGGVYAGYMVSYDQQQKFYYFQMPGYMVGIDPPEAGTVSEIIKGTKEDVSEEELRRINEYERSIYKFHLVLPPEKRWQFIEALCADQRKKWELVMQARGEGKKLSEEEQREAGVMLTTGIGQWKFSGFDEMKMILGIEGEAVATDFVFYVPTAKTKEETERRVVLIREGLSLLTRQFEDGNDPGLPRFSRTVVAGDGFEHKLLTETQGDGNYKNYLFLHDRLDDFYNRETNYATAK